MTAAPIARSRWASRPMLAQPSALDRDDFGLMALLIALGFALTRLGDAGEDGQELLSPEGAST